MSFYLCLPQVVWTLYPDDREMEINAGALEIGLKVITFYTYKKTEGEVIDHA